MVSRTGKFRGSRTHGRGKKSGRGAGIHGGRGNAGMHKHKLQHMLKFHPDHFGKKGFRRPEKVRVRKISINLDEVEERLVEFMGRGAAVKNGDVVTINLQKLGYDKLLARGRVKQKLEVEVSEASAGAKQKVESLGGRIRILGDDTESKNERTEGPDARRT